MAKLDVTDRLVGDLIAQVAPLVEHETGWSLGLANLNWSVLPKHRGYEEIVQGRLRSMGADITDGPRSLPERLVEIVLESNILAAYEPGSGGLSGTLFVVRENVDDSNLQGLMVILAHELVHRGQHLQYPDLFAHINAVSRSLYLAISAEYPDPQQINALLASVQKQMTMIESHAVYIQQRIQTVWFPQAQIESHFNFLNLLGLALAGQKARQYTEGLSEVAQAAGSGQVDALFEIG